MSVMLEALRLRQPLPTWPQVPLQAGSRRGTPRLRWPAGLPHHAANHLDAAEQAMRCARGAFASDALGDAADYVAEARASLLDTLHALEARP